MKSHETPWFDRSPTMFANRKTNERIPNEWQYAADHRLAGELARPVDRDRDHRGVVLGGRDHGSPRRRRSRSR